MEDISRDMERTVIPPGAPDSPKRSGGWTLLFIGGNGRIVRLYRFKALIAIWILIFLIASVAAVSFGFFYFEQASRNRALEDSVRAGRERIDELREETEILLARLVLAESQTQSTRSEGATQETPKHKEKLPQKEAQEQPISNLNSGTKAQSILNSGKEKAEKTAAVQTPAPSVEVEPKPASEAAVSSGGITAAVNSLVEVDDFFSIAEPDSNTLRINYKIRNVDPKGNSISGRTFLILKSKKEDPDKWIVLPEAPLEAGVPASVKNGRSFSITRFKTIRFKAPYHMGPEAYETATILIFDANGGLLLEKSFALIDKEEESEPTG